MVHRLSHPVTCGNLPGPGLKPVSPAVASGLLTTGSPGKPSNNLFFNSKVDEWVEETLICVFLNPTGFV